MRFETARSMAARISATLPRPPISKTNVPLGERSEWMARKKGIRVSDGRRIQCMAALEKILL